MSFLRGERQRLPSPIQTSRDPPQVLFGQGFTPIESAHAAVMAAHNCPRSEFVPGFKGATRPSPWSWGPSRAKQTRAEISRTQNFAIKLSLGFDLSSQLATVAPSNAPATDWRMPK